MQFPQAAALLLSTLATNTLAQTNQSPNFHLQLCTSNTTLDQQYLFACHTGAAEESLCPSATIPASAQDASWIFGYNYTTNTANNSTSGLVTWNLTFNGNETASQTLNYYTSPDSNVDLILVTFETDPVTVSFDEQQAMYVPAYDDQGHEERLYQWLVCQTDYLGYAYTTLNWLQGKSTDAPNNPSCVPVDVKRVFF